MRGCVVLQSLCVSAKIGDYYSLINKEDKHV